MTYRIILTIAASLALVGCTPYQEMSGVKGLLGGVQAHRIDESTVQILARGNAFTDTDTITRYTLRKAAEETVADGYDGFYIVSDQDRSRHQTISRTDISGTANGSTFINGTATGFGNTALFNGTANSTTFLSGTATTTAYNIIKPGETITIKMFRGPKPSNAPGVYDAHELLRYMVPPQRTGGHPESGESITASRQPNLLSVANPVPGSNPNTLEDTLRQVSADVKVPMNFGQNTVVTKVEAIGTQLRLTANISGQVPLISQYDNMASQICALEPQYQIFHAGASVRVVYLNAGGENIGAITMTRRECGL